MKIWAVSVAYIYCVGVLLACKTENNAPQVQHSRFHADSLRLVKKFSEIKSATYQDEKILKDVDSYSIRFADQDGNSWRIFVHYSFSGVKACVGACEWSDDSLDILILPDSPEEGKIKGFLGEWKTVASRQMLRVALNRMIEIGWRIDSLQFTDSRMSVVRRGIRLAWDGRPIPVASMIFDSKAYHREADFLRGPSILSYGSITIPDVPTLDLKFLSIPRSWPSFSGAIHFGRSNRRSGVTSRDLFDGRVKIMDLDLSKKINTESDTIELDFFDFQSVYPFLNRRETGNMRMRFDVAKREDGFVCGEVFWQRIGIVWGGEQRGPKYWSEWQAFVESVKTIKPGYALPDSLSFQRISDSVNFWCFSERAAYEMVLLNWGKSGLCLPRNSHWSCLADSLAGWYYEACGDNPASPILENKGKPVIQQATPQITPWGKMTWEIRGSKTGWFLPSGQRFLPRVFRTEKAPLVDDFWATPPKGVP